MLVSWAVAKEVGRSQGKLLREILLTFCADRWEERKHAWYLTLHDRAVAKCRATLASHEYKNPKK